jgi:hypothetical protein
VEESALPSSAPLNTYAVIVPVEGLAVISFPDVAPNLTESVFPVVPVSSLNRIAYSLSPVDAVWVTF